MTDFLKLNMKKISAQNGFTLVELMVGMVIGLLATIVIMNVYGVFEKQKRVTSGNSDAQTNGAIALYNLQRDIQSAGYGLPVYSTSISPFNCPIDPIKNPPAIDHDSVTATPDIGLSPILITDGNGQNGSDTIYIRGGDSMKGGIPINMEAGTATNILQVDNNIGCTVGDVALIINQPTTDSRALNCSMTKVTALTAAGVTPVKISLASNTNVAVGNSVACLGVWNEYQYTVNGNQLTRTGSLTAAGVPNATAVPIVGDIVNIQAQYGITEKPDFALPQPYSNRVTSWVDATNDWKITATTPTKENRNRIRAIRIAVVARNGLMEKTNVTDTCSSLTAANPTGLCAWAVDEATGSAAPAIDLSADPNWRRYRYRVYETIIPIKNIIWSRGAL